MGRNNLIQIRQGTASAWSGTNPILSSGEPGFDNTNNILKIGDGSKNWNNLTGVSLNTSGTTNFIPVFQSDGSFGDSIINESGNTIGINTPAHGSSITQWVKNIGANGSWIINESTASGYPVVFEARENGIRLGAMYSYGTAYTGGSFASIGSGGVAFSNITGPVAIGPLVASKDLIFGGGSDQYAKMTNTEFRINHDGLNRDFRVEGDSDQDLIVADASTDSVGIGTDTPHNNKLRIHHDIARYNSENTAHIKLQDSSGTIGGLLGADATGQLFYIQAVEPGSGWGKNIALQAMGGKVGISTIDPTDTLSVSGTTRVQSLNINGAFTFPTGDGSDGQAMVTDGSGNLSFANVSGAGGGGSGISDIVEDTTPQLGGNLDLNGKTIESGNFVFNSSNGNYDFIVSGTGSHPLIYVDPDSGTGRIGIGRKPDNYVLDVSGSTRVSPLSGATHFLTVHDNTDSQVFVVRNSGVFTRSPVGVNITGDINTTYGIEVYDTGTMSTGTFFFAAGNGTDAVGAYVSNINATGDSFYALGVNGSAVNWVMMNDASGRGTEDTFVLMKGNISSNDVKLAVTNSGDLGLGTDSPSGLLHTKAPDNESNLLIQEGSRASGSAQFLQKTHGYTSAGGLISYATGYTAGSLASVGSGGAALTNMGEFPLAIAPLYTGQPILFGAGNDEYMRLSNGNLGIGTNSPQATLDVNGTVQFDNLVRWEYPDKALDTGIDVLGYLRFYDEANGIAGIGVSTSSFNIGTTGDINIRFIGQQVELARFDTVGNFIFNDGMRACDFRIAGDTDANLIVSDASADKVGIGTSSPTEKLDIRNGDILVGTKLLVGSGVYSASSPGAYFGLKHTTLTGSSEYMIMSAGTHTYLSAKEDSHVYIRGGGNKFDHQIVVTETGVTIGKYRPAASSVEAEHDVELVYDDGNCVRIADRGGSGVMVGDCALSGNAGYAGIKHSDMAGSNDYMIVSDGSDTYISAKDGESVFIRGGGNAAQSEIRIHDVGAGGVGIVFNEAGSDRDIRMEGTSDTNLFRLDASTDRIGIGNNAPVTKLDVSGTITASGGNSTQWNTAYGWGDHSTSGYLTAHPNISAASSSDNSGQTFIQDILLDSNGHVTGLATATASGGGGGISNVVEDTSPQLGGNLLLESKDIIGTGNMNIVGTITGTSVTLGATGTQHLSIVRDAGGTFGNTVVTDLLGDITFAAQNTKIKMTNPAAGAQSVITMNPEGVNQDFIVEGNTDEHLLFADASTDKIGIGNSSPAHKLDVSGTINASTELRASGHPAIVSNTGVATGSVRITNIIMISSGTYASLSSIDSSTLYILTSG